MNKTVARNKQILAWLKEHPEAWSQLDAFLDSRGVEKLAQRVVAEGKISPGKSRLLLTIQDMVLKLQGADQKTSTHI